MPQIRTILAFIGGLIVALFVGLVPPELIGWLRDRAALGGPDASDSGEAAEPRSSGKRRRGSRRR